MSIPGRTGVAMMTNRVTAFLAAAVIAAGVTLAQPVAAEERYVSQPPSAEAMGFDLVFVRPLSLVGAVGGTALFVASLPFSILGMNADDAAVQLVGKPMQYTFLRPLGEFQDRAED